MDLSTEPPAASASASVALHANESNDSAVKHRSACDRCHSQKLRCVKNRGQVTCERCLRLKTSCRFSPRAPRASLRLAEQTTRSAQGYWQEPLSMSASTLPSWNMHASGMAPDGSDNNWHFSPDSETGIAEGPDFCYSLQSDSRGIQDVDWSGICSQSRMVNTVERDNSMSLNLIPRNENSPGHTSNFPLPGPSDSYFRPDDSDINDPLEHPPASSVQQLANLNVALYDIAEQLQSLAGACEGISGMNGNGASRSQKATLFAIDELFRLTTNFRDILQRFSLEECETSTPSSSMGLEQPDDQSAQYLVSYSQQVSDASQPIIRNTLKPPSRLLSQLDEATMLMVVSCHCRLVEIYMSFFQMMQACIQFSLAPRLGEDWAVILPKLQVGSLAGPPLRIDINSNVPSATKSMYMLMISMLSSQLWEQIAEVMTAGGDVPCSATRSRDVLVDVMWDRVTEKNERLSETIDATKNMLHRESPVVVE